MAARAFGAVGSLALHGALVAYVVLWGTAPPIDMELTLPSDVEFGLTDEAEVEAGEATTAPASPETPEAPDEGPEGQGAGVDAGTAPPDAGRRRRDAGTADAGAADAGPRDASPRDAGSAPDLVSSTQAGEGTGDAEGATRLPPGAAVAIRIDMARIRPSPLADDVRRFVQHNPHWRAIFDGAGVDPVDDFDRLMIASPDLRRERVLFAGRLAGGEQGLRDMVSRLGAARGADVAWRQESGVPVARWANQDDTERVIAIVGPGIFTITRPEDLPRLLAVARVRAERDGEADAAAGLLSMGEDELFNLEWEGYRRFFRGRSVPRRLVGGIRELEGARVGLHAEASYDSAAQAEEARVFWDGVRVAYARDVGIALIGLAGPLRATTVAAQDDRVRGQMELQHAQVRLGLGLLGPMLTDFEERYGGRAVPPADPLPRAPDRGE